MEEYGRLAGCMEYIGAQWREHSIRAARFAPLPGLRRGGGRAGAAMDAAFDRRAHGILRGAMPGGGLRLPLHRTRGDAGRVCRRGEQEDDT